MKITYEWGGRPDKLEGLYGLDCEGAQRNLRCVQVAQGEHAWLYDLSKPAQRATVTELLSTPGPEWVSHSSYDPTGILWSLGVDLTGRTRDSFLLSCLSLPGERHAHGLKKLATKFIDGDLEAGEARLHARFKEVYGGTQDEYLTKGYHNLDIYDPAYEWYSAADAVYCLKLYEVLKTQGLARVTGPVFYRGMREVDILRRSSERGLKVDTARVAELLPTEQEKVARGDARMLELTGLKARSPEVPWLLESMGVEFFERNEAPEEPTKRDQLCKGSPKLDSNALKVLLPRYKGTPAGEILEARALVSKSSNRVSNLKQFLAFSKEDGRVRAEYKTAAAATGRMSIVRPALQTLAAGEEDSSLRSCFIADPGHVFVGADFDSQELRVAACLSGDHELARRIMSGEDLHAYVANLLNVTRQVGKVGNFSCLFGAGPYAIARQTGLELTTHFDPKTGKEWPNEDCPAYQFRAGWWSLWPELKAWDLDNRRKTKEGEWPNNCVELDSGRFLPIDYPHKATNYQVQGTGRDLTQRAILHYESLMPGTIALIVHDEILVQVPERQAQDAMDALTEAMNFKFKSRMHPRGIEMPFTATAKILGDRWTKS